MPFVLAHLTDVHLPPPPGAARAGDWLSKRGLSGLNWLKSRRLRHLAPVAEAVAADLSAHAPDHVAVTGDQTNFGLRAEFEAGARWLARLGSPETVSFVPGNHDAMVRGAWEAGARTLAPYTTGDDGKAGFPWLRRRGPVALIGLNSAVPTPPFFASGRLGRTQLDAAEALLRETEGLCRVVLIHHPPALTCSRRKALRDRDALADMLARAGAELVLYGHNHRWEMRRLRGGALALCAPSGSMATGADRPSGAWRALAVAPEDGGWRLVVRERAVGPDLTMSDRATLAFRLPAALRP